VGGEKEIFGEDVVRPRTDLPDPNTPLRMFLTLDVSAGVFGGAPSVKEAGEMREREGIEEDIGLCFGMFCPVLGGEPLNGSGSDGGTRCCVGESGSSSEDSSLRSESNPEAVEGCGRLVPLVFRGESNDFRAFGVGWGGSGLVTEESMVRARGRPFFFCCPPPSEVRPLVLAFIFGFELSPSSQPSPPSSSSDES